MSPLLFYDRPVRLAGLIAVVVAIFCGLAIRFKNPVVAQTDTWNAITFGIVAIATTVFTMSIKIRALAQSKEIEYLSQTDLLTGAKNRNHYENCLQSYPKQCLSNLICVYADANGLHEMNNSEGHPAGDRMLREVAEVMQRFFGPEHTYRVGGDEFVVFAVGIVNRDMGEAVVYRFFSQVNNIVIPELRGEKICISVGAALTPEKGSLSFHELYGMADKALYISKKASGSSLTFSENE